MQKISFVIVYFRKGIALVGYVLLTREKRFCLL